MPSNALTTHLSVLTLATLLSACAQGSSASPDGDTPGNDITYSDQIARLFQEHCESCHREDGLGPFALTTYQETRALLPLIREAIETKRMPHGMSVRLDTECSDADTFLGPRQLTQEEIDMVLDWVDAGAPEGNPDLMPEPKSFHDGEWLLGQPDLELPNADNGFVVPGKAGRDIFRRFVLPIEFPKDRFITGFEAIPGEAGGTGLSHVVHHVTLFVGDKDAALSQERSFADNSPDFPGPGFEGQFDFPATLVGMWFPGSAPLDLGSDLGIRIPTGSTVIMEVHYASAQETVTDKTRIGLRLSDSAPSELGVSLVKNTDFVVPADDAAFEIQANRVIEEPVTLYSITPHMHQLGTDFLVTIQQPTEGEQCLADVKWDFEHQGTHWLTEPMQLAAGSRINVNCVYDNSADNPNQINFPPRDVVFGGSAELEMCQLTVGLVAPSAAPAPAEPRLAEVLYDVAGDDTDAEWVKLYNPGGVDIDLSNYALGWGGADYLYGTLDLSGSLPAGECVIIGAQTSGVGGQVASFVPALQNGGSIADGVALFHADASTISAGSVPVDVVIYGGSNSNGLVDATGAEASVDVGDAPSGSSLIRDGEGWSIGSPQPTACP
jgi:hypothetical protein